MMEDSLCVESGNKKGIKSAGILECLAVNHLPWGHDLIKTNDSYH